MITTLRRRPNRGIKARPVTKAAPVGGWNARDALELMGPLDAVTMQNWFPETGDVAVRNGFTEHATGVGSANAAVEMVAEYNVEATRKLLAAADGNIYDATSSGTATSLGSGFTDDRWAHAHFDGKMGFVNGSDAPQTFDGSTLGSMTVSGSGLTVANLSGIFVHESRSYFWEDGKQDFWYSALNTLGGSLTKFPLSRVADFGGNLVCAGSWNVEGGDSKFSSGGLARDLAVFVLSSGQAVVYQGDDPGNNWTKVGTYNIGAPVNRDAIVKVGGDLLVFTTSGVVSMSDVVQSKRLRRDGVLSDKISRAANEAAEDFISNAGWQLIHYPKGRWLLANIPNSSTLFEQYVMNLDTGAWARFTGMNARSWGLYDNDIYFGGVGKVYQANTGTNDDGSDIAIDIETAFDHFGKPGTVKRVSALGFTMKAADAITLSIGAQADYVTAGLAGTSLQFTVPATEWQEIDVNWEDWEEMWDQGGSATLRKWIVAGKEGDAIGCRIKADIQAAASWQAVTYMIEEGLGLT